MTISRASLSYQAYDADDIDPPFILSGTPVQQGGRVVMGNISGAPTLVSATPADNSGSVAVGANIVLTFNSAVYAGDGTIRIGDGYTQSYIDKGGLMQTRWVGVTDSRLINVSDSQVTFSDDHKTVTINLADDLKAGVNYSVTMAPGVLNDLSHRPYSGLADSSKLNFTTDTVVPTAPVVSMAGRAPQLWADDDSGAYSNDHLTNVASPHLRFITSGLSGFAVGDTLQIVDSNHGNAIVASHVLTAPELSGTNTVDDYFDLQLDSPLSEGLHDLALRVRDSTGNAGAASATPLALTIDLTGPTWVSQSPVPDATNVASDTTIVLTFNEDVDLSPQASFTLSDGNIQTEQQLGVESGDVSISGHTITITLAFALDLSSNYTLTLEGSPITDLAGNIGVDNGTDVLHFSTTATGLPVPGIPSLTFTDSAAATGGAATDGITNERVVTVGNLDGGSTLWYYSLDAGSSWQEGSGTSFNLGSDDHTYAIGDIQVKQTNVANVDSSVSSNTSALTLDLTAPDAHIAPASDDFTGDGTPQTITGIYTFSGTDESLVEISFDNGSHWTQASTSPLSAGINAWSVDGNPTGPIVVRISDAAGNTNGISGFSDKGLFLGSSGNDSFSYGTGAVLMGQDGDDGFTLNELGFGLVAGGDGSDTATLAVNHQTLDLSNISGIQLIGIDTIALGTGLHNTLAINSAALLEDVADLVSTEYTLTVTGDATDTLDLAGSTFVFDVTADNSVYQHYNAGHEHLLVGVAVNIVNAMTA